jgi:hypothetical protein
VPADFPEKADGETVCKPGWTELYQGNGKRQDSCNEEVPVVQELVNELSQRLASRGFGLLHQITQVTQRGLFFTSSNMKEKMNCSYKEATYY